MSNPVCNQALTRRAILRLSAAGALGSAFGLPSLASVAAAAASTTAPHAGNSNLYATLLQSWCDGLIAHQVTGIRDPALYGGLLCPACGIMHGRCGDAVYPLLRVAHTTGDERYLRAALLVHQWSQLNVSRADGSWINDVTLSPWQGITVFHTIALAEALEHHGGLLPAATRRQWDARLAAAAKFLDGFMTIDTGNINYPVTASLAFTLCGQRFNNQHYLDRAHALAHTALDYFTPNNFLFGEGHPERGLSAKGCHPVDLGYNAEESLPSLALYSLLNNDSVVLERTLAAMRTHMQFMLPDGGWDNSWGTRNYKWSYWGSRTSDGCHPAFVLLSPHEPVFREVAQRNLEQMAACTHNGLLYGGPRYFAHGDHACIHHTFTHAKALATVLDRGAAQLHTTARRPLPREAAYGVKSYPEIGTHLAAIGPWRATVTDYDWNYVEDVQTNGSSSGAGHATGGALSMLYHLALGPILTASMTEYAMVEISNQQAFTDAPHMPLTPRIECVAAGKTYTSLSDFAAILTARHTADELSFDAHGRLLTASHQPVAAGELHYRLAYRLTDAVVEITAEITADASSLKTPPRYILPIISRSGEQVALANSQTVRIRKPKGTLVVTTDAPQGFDAIPENRVFNLVPGFECVPLAVALRPGQPIRIRISTAPSA
jgi:hypothetical protein